MDAPTLDSLVLQDLYLFGAVLAVVGFTVYYLACRLAPLRRWSAHGTVPTGEFGPADVVLGGLLLTFLFLLQGGGQPSPEEVASVAGDPEQAIAGGVFMIVNVLLIAAVPLAYLGVVKRISLSELFGLRRLRAGSALLWALCGLVAVVIPMGIAVGANTWILEMAGLDTAPQAAVQLIGSTRSPVALALQITAAVLAAPVAEEIVFRGYLYPVIKRFSDRFFAALLSGFLFALAHSHLGTILPLTVLGIALAASFEITGCLLVPIGIHALFNTLSITLLLSGVGMP